MSRARNLRGEYAWLSDSLDPKKIWSLASAPRASCLTGATTFRATLCAPRLRARARASYNCFTWRADFVRLSVLHFNEPRALILRWYTGRIVVPPYMHNVNFTCNATHTYNRFILLHHSCGACARAHVHLPDYF